MKVSPARLADFTPSWLQERRAIILRDGHAVRAAERRNQIEVQAINTGTWHPLTLPGNVTLFATVDDRDAVLRMLTGESPIPA
ncbi:MAG: hypothetical protein KF715_08420 [Candidatus Didemnitutus sp.]|nr:hypothetical protein [Candidatus Didemnitutus sp.]